MASFVEKKLKEHSIDPPSGKKMKKTKKSQIKKFEKTYTIPVAYIGLVDIEKYDEYHGTSNDTHEERYSYRGGMDFKTSVGTGHVGVYMDVRISRDYRNYRMESKYFEMRERFDLNPSDVEAETYLQNAELRNENMGDGAYQSVTVSGGLRYELNTEKGHRDIYSRDSPRTQSVEDFLDWVTTKSNEAWGEVTIAVSDLEMELEEFRQAEESLPSTFTVSTAMGDIQFTVSEYYDRGYTPTNYPSMTEDNINLKVSCSIVPVVDYDADWGSDVYATNSSIRNRSITPASYEVRCKGTITDNNTQVEPSRREMEHGDSWTRDFGHQGALQLEDAKQILVQNIDELVEEWNAYRASARNYVEVRNGPGYRRTTENTESWDYNFGDTEEDLRYDRWQDREMEDRIRSELYELATRNTHSEYHVRVDTPNGMYSRTRGTDEYSIDYEVTPQGEFAEQLKNGTMTPEEFKQRTLSIFTDSLVMSNYEILEIEPLSYYGSNGGFTVRLTVKPTVAKSKDLRKSVRKSFLNMRKHFGKTEKAEKEE